MSKFYSVCPIQKVCEGALLKLSEITGDKANPVYKHIQGLFPEGLSYHGRTYLWKHLMIAQMPFAQNVAVLPGDVISILIEKGLEEKRRAEFAEKTSRFQSFFAWDNLEDAQWFHKAFRKSDSCAIFEVFSDHCSHKGDMNLFGLFGDIATVGLNETLYWVGKVPPVPNEKPRWEYLLDFPVRIGKRVI